MLQAILFLALAIRSALSRTAIFVCLASAVSFSIVNSDYARSEPRGAGADLLADCGLASSSMGYNYCLGFIMGVADSFDCEQPIMSGFRWQPIADGNAAQFRKVVVKWLNDHPEHLHLRAGSLVAAALSEAFPCP
jgi:hypothetical protein